MFFFLNDGINFNKSGIEHAQIKRLRLFNEYGQPAKIVTRQLAMNLHEITADAGIADKDFVNLFDFFQGTTMYKPQRFTMTDLDLPSDYTYEAEGDEKIHVKDHGQQIMIVAKRSKDDDRLNWVQYFGSNGRLVHMVWYDTRGFAALEQFFSFGTKLVSEQLLAPNGKVVYQRYRLPKRDGAADTSLQRIIDFHGRDYEFAGFNDLTTFFLDQLNYATGEANAIIVDRTFELAWAVQHMDTPIFKVMHLHNNHVNDSRDSQHSDLNFNYQYMITNRRRWDGIIALTPWQYDDFTKRFGKNRPKVYDIPGAVTDDAILKKPHVKWATRKPHSVIMVARLSPEKQQDDLIHAWKTVHQQVPDATLDFWGYSNGDTGKQLRELVTKLGLNDTITFNDYSNNISKVYEAAQLLILPSRAEGLPLTLVEAQAHGLPIIATDIKYGPRDVVNDTVDGFLIKNHDISALADKIIELLTHPKEIQEFSENAYKDSWKYSGQSVWKKWLQLVKDAQKQAQVPERIEVS
ncbi:glycosyltransferase [Lentilactobacillus parafarraginis]|jgi:poly(glycerol-phosphate) alpha-glucosyltransferase|uniref:Glycosyltransferase n=1 Tax=Lentilactobacillus parafarraginis TaxID=390842 RepID=A0A5R9CYH2_9LACO|nr:glycosyltransferase [Lentilactobacillus parafarraginis]TLQ20832.1 glycosyltransferase [Lentilactobacillus parafarraginis]